jgi:exodeoxyribonuclease-1
VLQNEAGLAAKIAAVFGSPAAEREPSDPDLALYHGFFSDFDRKLLRDVRGTPPDQLATARFGFNDSRCAELLFRYRARNWPSNLSVDEAGRWEEFRRNKLAAQTETTTLTLDDYFREIALRRTTADGTQTTILDALEQWGREII